MDGAMGKEEEVVEAVLTCEGDFHDPELLNHLEKFRLKLRDLILADEAKLSLKKVEPWNSVKVTFTIPREAALRLRQLAQTGNEALQQMGVLSVQIQGDSSISLKIAGRNNETTELMLQTSKGASMGSLPVENSLNTTDDVGSSPGPSNEEVTRKNIVDYLIQGPPHLRQNAIFNSILGVNAPAATPNLGPNRGVAPPPDSFPGLGNRPLLRPNSIANMAALPSPALRGSHPNGFPFAKTTGAFHIPIPHQSSAGQSVSGIPNQQMNSFPVNKNIPGHMNSPGLQHCGSQQMNMQVNMNTFGPIGSKLPSSSNISSTPPSSSPGFMIDLPPPPPYPHNSCNNTSKSGKQVSASSPLLVNLLQTDPIAVAASSSSKTVTAGATSPAPPVKKKKRPKKTKEAVSNSYSNLDDIVHNRECLGINSNMFNPAYSVEMTRTPTSSATFSSKLQKEYFPGSAEISHGFSHVLKSESKTISDKAFKPLVSSDRPFSENSVNSSAFTFAKLNTSVDSAISSDHVGSKETNGPGEEIIDSFSREIAAGKIINPYTGQLEPRDSILDSSGGKLKDHLILPEEITSFIGSYKAKEIGSSNVSNVPASVSQVNILKSFSSVSSSTAAFFHSGSSPHLSGDTFSSQIPPHRKNLSDSSNVSTSKNIYAAKHNSKPEMEHCLTSISSTLSQSTFSPQYQVSVSSIQHQMKSSNILPSAATGASFNKTQQRRPLLNQHVQSGLPPHTVPSSSVSSGVSESVINSNLGSSCSSTALPVTNQDTFVKRLEHNQSLFHLTSCANSNTQTPFSHHSLSSRMFSSSSPSVVQTRPVSSQAQSSFQASERLKSTDMSKSFSSQQAQAASSDSISSSSTTTKTNFPQLLNSLPEKSLDQHVMIQSPVEKVSPEGDDNSNHSGLVSENLPEGSGTSVLLEHANVKAENHDSGVGSSSERSDDTPSEPGDGEFRANANCSESEESNKTTKRLVNCNSSNTITVGYMMSSVDTVSQPKSSQPREGHESIKTTSISLAKGSSNMKIDALFDTHNNSFDKSMDLPTSHPLLSADWMGKESRMQSSTYSGKMRLNGPVTAGKEDRLRLLKKEFKHENKLNGPSAKEMEEMLFTMADLQGKTEQLPSKHNAVFKRHGLHLQHEVLEEMAKLQQMAASKDLTSAQGKLEKEESSESIPRGLGSSEERPDHLPFFDMEDLVNGKLFGNGTSNIDSKTGSNITSIYSKRSSPVNVNMLNHIYAPGLPLPRRLTESVQRLVKPLPASESSMPQVRLCKSPGSPRAGSGINGPSPSRMALQSGTRSPGASIPRLLSNDKHSLLSGSLDLAGLSKFSPNSLPHSDFASESMSDSSSRMLGLTTDFLSREGQSHGFLSSCHVSPPLMTDSLAHSHKMLSQSYPPHKSRDLSNNVTLYDLFSHMQPHQSSSAESVPSSLQDPITQLSKSSCEPAISSHPSQVWPPENLHNAPKTGAQTGSFPVSTLNHSVFSSTHDLVSESFQKNKEIVSLPKNSNTCEVFSLSSPNHSSSVSPTFLANSDRVDSSNLSNTSAPTLQSTPGTSVSAPRAKISLSNGSSSSLINQKVAISTQNNVPYLTSSSSTVASSAALLAKSVISRVTPAVSNALLLSGSNVRDTTDPLLDNFVLKSTKSDTNISPRTLNKSDYSLTRSGKTTPVLSRNLFESVSCDLTGLPHSIVHTSWSKAIDPLVSHSSSKSVLHLNHAQDLNIQGLKTQRKRSDSAFGPISPQLNYDSDIVLNSSHSIRTNETPSTSLPAQVVHLDFPHFPPSVSESSIANSLSVSPKLVKSPIQSSKVVVNHNWNPSPTSPTPVTSLPVTSGSTSKIDSVAQTSTSVTSEKKDYQNKDLQRAPSPSLVKEPILETLASALGSSLTKMEEDKSSEIGGMSSISISVTKEDNCVETSNEMVPGTSDKSKSEVDTSTLSSEQNVCLEIPSRKRSYHLMEGDQKEETNDSLTDHSTAKHFVIDSIVSEVGRESHTNVTDNTSSTTKVIDKNTPLNSPPSNVNPLRGEESEKNEQSPILESGDSNNHCSSNDGGETSTIIQSSLIETKDSVEDSRGVMISSREEKPDSCSNSTSETKTSSDILNRPIQQNDHITALTEDEHVKEGHILEMDEKESEILKVSSAHEGLLQCNQSFVHGSLNKEEETCPLEKEIVILGTKNVIEDMSSNIVEDSHSQSETKKDIAENIADPESLTTDAKMDEGAKKGHRPKRQFYAYVPEKSIDQTYFDTPILSGRTRSRNKPSEPANPDHAANLEGSNVTIGSSDSQASTVVAGLKTDSAEAVGIKRSTRSLRTKDNTQDISANKRRRLQPRDHR